MRFFLIFSIILLFANTYDIKVISYNIRYNNPNDGKDIWENRRSSIVNYVIDEDPDFIGFQEVTFSQLNYLNLNLPDYNYVGVGRDDGKNKGEFSPIYFKKSKFKLIDSSTFWLSTNPEIISVGWDASMERICTYGLFKHKKSKKEIWVFNTHLDHIGAVARLESSRLIVKKIKELTKEDDYVILTGDFNAVENSKPILILNNFLMDTNNNLNKTNSNYGTYNGFKLNEPAINRIDYVFQKNFNLIKSGHHHVKTNLKRWASDHNPVYANLKF